MDQSVKVVTGEFICLRVNHDCHVKMIVMDDQVPIYDRLLCYKCFEQKRQISRYISLEEASGLIEEKLQKQNQQQIQLKYEIVNNLNDFQNKMMNIKSRLIEQIDEILRISELWKTDVTNIGRKSDINNFIEDLQLLQQDVQIDQDQFKKSNESHHKKIDMIIKKLINQEDYEDCIKLLKQILTIRTVQQDKQNIKIIEQTFGKINSYIKLENNQQQDKQLNVKNVQLINTVQQQQWSYAIAFNNTGSTMVAGCGSDIIVRSFEQGKMIEKKKLYGHSGNVYCLVFSKKHNWFASGSGDCTIRCWKEDDKKDWVSTQPGKQHTQFVSCLILNNQEDQLISCSVDKTIKVWKVNCQVNQLEYDYTLENWHTKWVCCISVNDSETYLVSCDRDKRIILWSKDQNNRWIYKNELRMNDWGYRICFISENQIIWQQQGQGITHLLEQSQGKLINRSYLNLNLNQENNDDSLFPTIRNKKRQIIIQKHNHYVYILKQQSNGSFTIVSEPIDCSHKENYGNLHSEN